MLAFLIVFGALFGLVFGSFATVLAARVPWGESIGGRSRCRSCAAQIAAYDNIPVLSWILLRGRCRHCGATIGIRYPLTELTAGALGAYVAIQPWPLLVVIAWMCFVPVAVSLAVIDLESKRLPNPLTLGYLPIALVLLAADASLNEIGRAHV